MSPGPVTKNDCAGEDQQQIIALLRVVTDRLTLLSSKRKFRFKIHKIWSCMPMGPETKNDCADKDQHQIPTLLSL
jgi:hypothetical protein